MSEKKDSPRRWFLRRAGQATVGVLLAAAGTGRDAMPVKAQALGGDLDWLTKDLSERQDVGIHKPPFVTRDLSTGEKYGVATYWWKSATGTWQEGGYGLKVVNMNTKKAEFYQLPSNTDTVSIGNEIVPATSFNFIGTVNVVEGSPIVNFEAKSEPGNLERGPWALLAYNPETKSFVGLERTYHAIAYLGDHKMLANQLPPNKWAGPGDGLGIVDLRTGKGQAMLLDNKCLAATYTEAVVGDGGEKSKRLFVIHDWRLKSLALSRDMIGGESEPGRNWEELASFPPNMDMTNTDIIPWPYENQNPELPVTPDGKRLLFYGYVRGCGEWRYREVGIGIPQRIVPVEYTIDGIKKIDKVYGMDTGFFVGIVDLTSNDRRIRFVALPEGWGVSQATEITDEKLRIPSYANDGNVHEVNLMPDANDKSGLLKDEVLFVTDVQFEQPDAEGESNHNFVITVSDGRKYNVDLSVGGLDSERQRELRNKINDAIDKSGKTGDPLFFRYGGLAAPSEFGGLTLDHGPGAKKDAYGIVFGATLLPL